MPEPPARLTDGAIVSDPRRPLVIPIVALTMGALLCLVVIACANISTLLLSQADVRRQEISIRLALGAGRGRLLRMLLTETILLATAGGVGAVWLAGVVPALLFRFFAGGTPPYSLAPDWRIFAFLAATTLLAGLASGLAPALESLRIDLLGTLKGHRTVAGQPGGAWLRGGLVVIQIALSFVLLAGAGLFAMTHYRIVTGEPGFEADHLLIVRGDAPPDRIRRALETLPGARVTAASATAPVLPAAAADVASPDGTVRRVEVDPVSPEYFQAVGIAIERGRPLTPADTPCGAALCHAVATAAYARQLAGAGDAVGLMLRGPHGPIEIVGVAADISAQQIGTTDPPMLYTPFSPGAPGAELVRFDGDPAAFTAAASERLRRDFPRTITDARTARWFIDAWIEEIGPVEVLILALGATAAGLAMIGVFGIVSLNVARRTPEIGIRLALGAPRSAGRAESRMTRCTAFARGRRRADLQARQTGRRHRLDATRARE